MDMSRLRRGLALPRFAGAAALAATMGLVPLALDAQAPQTQPPPKTGTATAAKPAADKLPAARSIIAKYIAAIGGREAILSHSSTRSTGTFTVSSAGMTGSIELFAAKPNKSLVKITLAGVGEITEGFDGTTGWTISPMTGPMLLQGKQLEEKRFDTDFYGELHDDSRYESMTTVERTDFDGRPCYKIRLVRKNGGEDFEFYDVATGLKVGRIATRETQMGTVTGTAVETDYRKFGNLLLPATIKNSLMGVQQVITIQTIEYDGVPAAAFEPPAEIKALIK
jgi:hypothetical protein